MVDLSSELLRLRADSDTDSSIQIISSWISDANEGKTVWDLQQFCSAITEADAQSLLDPMHVIPELLSSDRTGAENMLNLVANYSSAKEVTIVLQEHMEYLQRLFDDDDDGDQQQKQQQALVSPPNTLCRIVSLYAIVIPRMQLKRRTAAETLKSTIRGLDSAIESASLSASVEEGRALLIATAKLVSHATQWTSHIASPEKDKDDCVMILDHLLQASTGCLESTIQASLAQRRFQDWEPRLARRLVLGSDWEGGSKAIDAVEDAYKMLYGQSRDFMQKPSITSLVLLAHSSGLIDQTSIDLHGCILLITTCLQKNLALDAALAFLICYLSRHEVLVVEPSAAYALSHVVAMTSAIHHDPTTRLIAWRILKAVVERLSSQAQLGLLQELCSPSSPIPSQLRIAAVGLAKEVISSALGQPSPSALASPQMLQVLGPLILRTDPPDLFERLAKAPLQDFIDTPEPKRLIEVLGFYYVVSSRDSGNKTGINDRGNQEIVYKTLLLPLQAQLLQWHEGVSSHGDHETSFILSALQIGLDRVSSVHP